MKKIIFYLILLIIFILLIWKYNKPPENFTLFDFTQKYFNLDGVLEDGNYLIKVQNEELYLGYDLSGSNYMSSLIIPNSDPPKNLSSLYDISGKIIMKKSFNDSNIIFNIINNKIKIPNNSSSILVWSNYGLTPNNENCSLITLSINYNQNETNFNFLNINPDYTLGNSYLKLDKNAKITTFKNKYVVFNFLKLTI
jgi:hypothetical protein